MCLFFTKQEQFAIKDAKWFLYFDIFAKYVSIVCHIIFLLCEEKRKRKQEREKEVQI